MSALLPVFGNKALCTHEWNPVRYIGFEALEYRSSVIRTFIKNAER
ncbi:hypothetical protein [Pseudomonas fluorescens]|nr:hypothetical protein [Pseudomonas fluorescens]